PTRSAPRWSSRAAGTFDTDGVGFGAAAAFETIASLLRPSREVPMEAGSRAVARAFDHLREHSIRLRGVLFQSIMRAGERIYVGDETVDTPTATPVAVT